MPAKKVTLETRAVAAHPVVARATELIAAGMNVEAGEELEKSEKDLLKRFGGEKSLGRPRTCIAAPATSGERTVSARRTRAGARRPLIRAPTRGRARCGRRRSRAPTKRWSKNTVRRREPLFLTRSCEESATTRTTCTPTRAVSVDDPPTSTKVAASANEPFSPTCRTTRTSTSGRREVHRRPLYKKFGNEIEPTVGAYNAGPRAMTRWCEQHGKHPTHESVELIVFAQTREYVKRVNASIDAKIRHLYAPRPRFPLTLTTTVAKTGPDYQARPLPAVAVSLLRKVRDTPGRRVRTGP